MNNNNILCFLIPALVGLIAGFLGYLLGRRSSGGGDDSAVLKLQSELDACRANANKLNSRISTLESDLASAKSASKASKPEYLFDSELAATVFGKKIVHDDLKIVEGIGPKIEELYHNEGIKTWKGLSETSVKESQAILDKAGEAYVVHDPSTWAKQAELAYHGKWQELKDWQDKLTGGRE
jgi:predicted flap endonuclease-1-like 5' DNA nuclease